MITGGSNRCRFTGVGNNLTNFIEPNLIVSKYYFGKVWITAGCSLNARNKNPVTFLTLSTIYVLNII